MGFLVLYPKPKPPAGRWTIAGWPPAYAGNQPFEKGKNAVILAHSYTGPDLVYGVADFRGDSYELSLKAREVSADVIIFAGVWFMAETAKIINPQKQVFIPAGRAGCTLADSMTGADLMRLKAKHPGVPVLCYINSSADVKAQCDACVTSGNVFDIAQKLPGKELIFVPDMLMAQNLEAELKRRGTPKKLFLRAALAVCMTNTARNMLKNCGRITPVLAWWPTRNAP